MNSVKCNLAGNLYEFKEKRRNITSYALFDVVKKMTLFILICLGCLIFNLMNWIHFYWLFVLGG